MPEPDTRVPKRKRVYLDPISSSFCSARCLASSLTLALLRAAL